MRRSRLLASSPLVIGGNAGALGLLAVWAVPAVLERRADPDGDEHDLLGVLVLGLLVAAMPLATSAADPVAGTAGGLIGIVLGLVLARRPARA